MNFLFLIAVCLFSFLPVDPGQEKRPVILRHSEEKVLHDQGIKVRFIEVVEDSRCPKGVNCVWTGVAVIRLKVSNEGGESCEFELNTNQKDRSANYNGWVIRLETLDPYPEHGVPRRSEDYVARLTIQRAPIT